MRQYFLPFFFVSGISFCCLTTINSTQAQETQIIPDGTLPINSVVEPPEGNIRTITKGTEAGSNLFHSFGQFNIKAGDKADFVSPSTNIENILVRVTGGSRSEIMGTISTSGLSQPNLFLINPSGIIFGPNARLDVRGSFVATTANAIAFGNQGFFNASVPNNPALLTVKPSAFLFNQIAAGSITNQSRVGLEVPTSQSLLLVGGDVSLDGGTLRARGGRVELGGVAGSGTVGLNFDSSNLRLNFPSNVVRADVSLANANVFAEGGGNIAISAQTLRLQESSLKAGVNSVGTQVGNITLDAVERMTILNSLIFNNVGDENSQVAGNTGTIEIEARSLSLNNTSLKSSTFGKGNAGGVFVQTNDYVDIVNSFISSDVEMAADGNTGGVHFKAGSLSLTDGATVSASTFGKGNAGGVFVQANNSVDIANSFIIAKAEKIGAGNGGDINIQAKAVSLTDGTILETSTYTEGLAGNVIIDARNTVFLDNSFISGDTFGSGNGGNIDIKARALSLTNGAELLSRTFGEKNGGRIQINASDSVTISGVNPVQGNLISGLITSSEGSATGQGGNISITTGNLRVSEGAVVSARSRSTGRGGNINVNTNTLELTSGGQLLTSAFRSGSAGNITVNAADRVSISGSDLTFAARLQQFGERLIDNDGSDSGLFARVRRNQAANAGNIEVTARDLRLDKQGTITTETTSGEGGNISLNARDIILSNNSSITASAGTAQAGGNGGNINIDTNLLVSYKNSNITANAFEGQGGNIRINTQGLFLSPDSVITADSELGIDGVVETNILDFDPTSGLVNLPAAPPVDTQVAQACQPRRNQQQSEFIITGRGGLPPNPGETLIPDAVQVDLVALKPETETHSLSLSTIATPTPVAPQLIVEATEWVKTAEGEVFLIAHASNVTPYSSLHSIQCGL